MKPRIAFLDIETAPTLLHAWGVYEVNSIEVERDWYILCFAVRWMGEKTTRVYALPHYPNYRPAKHDDKRLCKDLFKVLDEADIVIAQNGDAFDIKKIKTRLLIHGFKPPQPFKSVDTLKVLRREFAFDANKLNAVCRQLHIGRKIEHNGAPLWFACMSGDKKAWALMKKYNAHDVDLLHDLYIKLRPWIQNHPNLNLITGNVYQCPNCGGNTMKRGFNLSRTGKRQRYQCLKCHAFSSGEIIKIASPLR